MSAARGSLTTRTLDVAREVSAREGSYADDAGLRRHLIWLRLLVPAEVVEARPKPAHPQLLRDDGSPWPLLRLIGTEHRMRENYLPPQDAKWRPRWRHAGELQ